MLGKLRNMTAIYLLKGEKVLLLYRKGGRVVTDVWTGSAGGHFESDELNDARACVLRELREELGLGEEHLEGLTMRYIALRNTKGEIRQNYYFFAQLRGDAPQDLRSAEGDVKWFSLDELGPVEMPLSAKFVMDHYCAVGRYTDKLYAAVVNPEGATFTDLSQS